MLFKKIFKINKQEHDKNVKDIDKVVYDEIKDLFMIIKEKLIKELKEALWGSHRINRELQNEMKRLEEVINNAQYYFIESDAD